MNMVSELLVFPNESLEECTWRITGLTTERQIKQNFSSSSLQDDIIDTKESSYEIQNNLVLHWKQKQGPSFKE